MLVTGGAAANLHTMKVIKLLPLLVLAACATGPSRTAVLNGLVGQSETEVVRQLGVPSRTFATPGHTFLAYTQQRAQVLDGGPFLYGGGFYGGGFYGSGFGLGGAFPVEIVQRVCETTIDIADGRMLTWSLRGNACG